MSFDGLAARQAGDRLIDDGLEHACRDVLFRRAVVDERLYVRLGENAAPRRDGVYGLMSLRVFVEPFRVRAEQVRHLVDERAGAPAQVPFMRCSTPPLRYVIFASSPPSSIATSVCGMYFLMASMPAMTS